MRDVSAGAGETRAARDAVGAMGTGSAGESPAGARAKGAPGAAPAPGCEGKPRRGEAQPDAANSTPYAHDLRIQATLLAISCVALAAWAALIFFMSANDGDASTGLSDGVIVWLANAFWPGYQGLSPADQLALVESLSFPVRKLAHFSEYAVLGLLAFATFHQVGKAQGRKRANAGRKHADAPREHAHAPATPALALSGAPCPKRPAPSAPRARATHHAPSSPCALLRQAAAAVAFSFLYACLDEFHQLFVAGRCGQPADVTIDTAGALVAVAVALAVARRKTRA